MFCKNCGANLDDRAVVCPHCGILVDEAAIAAPQKKEETNVLAIIGFALAFFVALAGLICSALGLKKAKEMNGKGHGLALAGLIISIISMAIVVIMLIYVYGIYFATLGAIYGAL